MSVLIHTQTPGIHPKLSFMCSHQFMTPATSAPGRQILVLGLSGFMSLSNFSASLPCGLSFLMYPRTIINCPYVQLFCVRREQCFLDFSHIKAVNKDSHHCIF